MVGPFYHHLPKTVAITTPLLHYHYSTTTPPLHHHHTTTTPLPHHHYTTTTPPLYHHNTTTIPPPHHHNTTTTLPLYTIGSPLLHHCTTTTPPLYTIIPQQHNTKTPATTHQLTITITPPPKLITPPHQTRFSFHRTGRGPPPRSTSCPSTDQACPPGTGRTCHKL